MSNREPVVESFGRHGNNPILWLVVMLLFVFAASGLAEAHTAPPDDISLLPIEMLDGDKRVQIHLQEVIDNYRKETGKRENADVACSFRALQTGIAALWQGDIPSREDIQVTSALPSYGSVFSFQYLLSKNEDNFVLTLPYGTRVDDLSFAGVSKLTAGIDEENYVFIITRKSTGASFTAKVKKEVFPAGHFLLMSKVYHQLPAPATEQELDQLANQIRVIKNKFYNQRTNELFVNSPGKPLTMGGILAVTLVVLLTLFLVLPKDVKSKLGRFIYKK